MAKQKLQYRIAGLVLEISLPESLQSTGLMPSFEPFQVDEPAAVPVCVVEVTGDPLFFEEKDAKLLSDVSAVWTERFRFYERGDCYLTSITTATEARVFFMKSSKDFSSSVVYMPLDEQQAGNVLSWLIMVAFGQVCLKYQAILIHASVVEYGGKGIAFLGKSGTGKSTHSRLWLEHIEGATLLNDDNPAVRIEADGWTYIYGTPWSGKTPCYKNRKVKLNGFVRLKQAPFNQFSVKHGMEALVCVLPSCTAIRWNKPLFTRMTDTVETLVQALRVAELECLPNEAAVALCHHGIYNS